VSLSAYFKKKPVIYEECYRTKQLMLRVTEGGKEQLCEIDEFISCSTSLEQHQLLVEPPIALLKILIWSFNGQNLNSANELFPSLDLASGISYQQN